MSETDREPVVDRLDKFRNSAFLPTSYIAIAGVGLVFGLNIVAETGSSGYFELSILIALIINMFASFKISGNVTSVGLVAIIGIFFAGSNYLNHENNLALYLLFLYPMIAILLLGTKRGSIFVSLLMLFVMTQLLSLIDVNDSFSNVEYMVLMSCLVLVSALVGYYEHMLESHVKLYMTKNDEVTDVATSLQQEVERREKVEEEIVDALNQLEENNRELERARAMDDAVITNIGEALLAVNKKGVITRTNPSSGRILGLNQEDLMSQRIGKSLKFAAIGKEEDILGEKDLVISRSLEHRSIERATYQITKPDGSMFYAQVTSSPLVVGGEVYGAVVVIRDITEEVTLDRAKSEFASIASHQLRTPLSTINWYLELVLAGDFGEINDEQREYIGEAASASKRMGELINSLLNASRVDVGVIEVSPKQIDIRDIVSGVMYDLETKIKEKSIKLNVDINDSVAVMSLDPTIMEIIFMNLMSNAVKYSPEKSEVNVRVDLDKYLEIVVEDHGYGIPISSQQKIFTKMFRAENAMEHEPDGNGLGLYLVKSIMAIVGGTIDFTSKEGEGTIFTVRLPREGMKERSGKKKLYVKPNSKGPEKNGII